MRLLLTFCAVLAFSVASVASAAMHTVLPGGTIEGTLYNMNVSEAVDVGSGLIAVVISIENISGNADFDVNSTTDAQFGTASGLHHDFVFGAVTTPLATSTDAFGLSPSSVDSYWLPDGQDASPVISAPTESGPLVSVGAPTELTNGATGIGSGLTGQFGFASAGTVNLVRLVFPAAFIAPDAPGVDFGFSVADADVGSQGERFVGTIVGIPEPTTAILAMIGLVGVAARRRS